MDSSKFEYAMKTVERNKHLEELKKRIIASGDKLEGNCFYDNNIFKEISVLFPKQLNLFWCGKQIEKKLCEIGFNAGHSAVLFLMGMNEVLSSTPITFTIFDINLHSYTKTCFEYIRSTFSHVNFEFIEGDSTKTVQNWIEKRIASSIIPVAYSYDVIHVDGGHSEHCISNDLKHADYLVKKGGLIIIDDTNNDCINWYVNRYVADGRYIEVELFPTSVYPHRVIKKIL